MSALVNEWTDLAAERRLWLGRVQRGALSQIAEMRPA